MNYIRKMGRRLYNTALAVRHRTGRTEQLLIAMNAEAHQRNEAILRQFHSLQQAVKSERSHQSERSDFLFQALKALEARVGETVAAQTAHTEHLALQSEREEFRFQVLKALEARVGETVAAQTQGQAVKAALEDLRQTMTTLATAQAAQAEHLALQSEREEFRFDTQKVFQTQVESGQTRVEATLEALQNDLATGQTQLSERLGQIEKLGSDIHTLLLAKDNLRDFAANFVDRKNRLGRIPKLKDVFHDYVEMVEEGMPFKLWGYDVSYLDRKALWIQINELIFREEYYFSDDFSAPHTIIDGGANIGLSILFFKALYPNAKVIAFEPNDACYEIAERNIRQNGLTDVTLIKAAIGPEDGEVAFYINQADSMGASVAPRHLDADMLAGQVTVPMAGLAAYLDTPVDFLKLDIEGNEAEVLQSVQDRLGNVRNIFCEYHFSDEYKQRNKLRDIVDVLDDGGFDFQIAKSVWFGEHSERRPVTYVGQDYSGVIYAKKRETEGTE